MAEGLQTSPAQPLTFNNVLSAVKNVQDWRQLCRAMLGYVPEEIQSQHNSDEDCLKNVIKLFLRSRSVHYDKPSWRAVIHSLYKAQELELAEQIESYAEAVQDPTLTIDNVIRVMETVPVDRRREVWSHCSFIPNPLLEEIYQKYSTEDQRLHACVDFYVNFLKDPSWTNLCWRLFRHKEFTAVRKAKTFIAQTDPTLTVDNVTGVMKKATNDSRERVWREVFKYSLVFDNIKSKCSSEKELLHTCSDIYVNCLPDSSWKDLARRLYNEVETAAVEEVRSYLDPRDLTLTTERLMELFASVDDVYVNFVGGHIDTPLSKVSEFHMNYKDPARKKEAYLDYYVHNHPLASWSVVAGVLRGFGLSEQATLVEDTYIKVNERTRLHFEEAMSGGSLWIRNGNTFYMGPGGSGKTHTLAAVLEEDPPPTRESTACAKTPVRAVAQMKMEVSGTTHFVRLSEDTYSEMLANSVGYPPPVKKRKLVKNLRSSKHSSQARTLPQKSSGSISPSVSTEESSVHCQQPVAKPDLKRELLCRIQAKSKVSECLEYKDLVNNRDSGGQSMFHEVLPVFVTKTSFGIMCVKLNECLDDRPMVEYFINGKRIGKPFKSPFTHLQTFRHCVKFFQSNSNEGACPKLVFVGTHADLEHECKGEDRKAKNEKLLSIVPPEMREHIIFKGKDELLFPINAKRPGKADRKIIADIRTLMIQELQKIPRQKVPLRYFSLEMMFQRLLKHKRKAVWSFKECFEEASAYNFTNESFIDALRYLHNLKLISYYEDVLPDVVFIDSQVLLDKITELVEFSIQLESNDENQDPTIGSLEMFKSCGIITTEILSKFKSSFVPGLFEEKELIKIFLKLFIIAEMGRGKYLMACLLREEEIASSFNRSTHQVVPDLFYNFGRDGAKLGVYCFLVSSLINEAKWKLLIEEDKPVKLSRNRARFTTTEKYPGFVTITDSFSTFFSVKIEFPEKVKAEQAVEICKKVCPTIRETILANIQVAYRKLNYTDSPPQAAFLCSEHEATSPHPAVVSEDAGFLICTTHPGSVCSEMTDEHKVWLGKLTSKASLPAELTIKDLSLVLTAAWPARLKWFYIGLQLNIEPGTLNVIEGNNVQNIDDCFTAMLSTWLKTVNPKPTSAALANALRSPIVGYANLATGF